MKNEILKFLVFLVILIFVVANLVMMLYIGLDKNEKVECRKWQKYSVEYPGFYLTQWQKTQCDSHQIFINSPIK